MLWPTCQQLEGGQIQLLPRLRVRLAEPLRRRPCRPELARIEGSQASSRIGSLQGADLLLEIRAELGSLEAGTEL